MAPAGSSTATGRGHSPLCSRANAQYRSCVRARTRLSQELAYFTTTILFVSLKLPALILQKYTPLATSAPLASLPSQPA